MSLQQFLKETFRKHASRTALVSEGHTTSYAVLRQRVDSISRTLLELGCTTGWRIAYLKCAGHAYVEMLLACAQIGAVFCPLSPRIEPELLMERLEDLHPQMVVLNRDLLATLDKSRLLNVTRRLIIYPSAHRFLSYQNLSHNQLVLRPIAVEPQQPVVRLLDETTGSPEIITYGQLMEYLDFCRNQLCHSPCIALICIPYTCRAYIQELCLGIACGDTMLPMESFEAKDFIKLVTAWHINSVFLTPSIINAVDMDARFLIGDFSSLQLVRLGQAYLDQDTAYRLRRILPPTCILEKYTGFPTPYAALTLPVKALDAEEWDAATAPLNSIGTPFSGWSVRTDSERTANPGRPLPLQIRAPGESAWHALGTNGWVDSQGLIHFSWEVEPLILPLGSPFSDLRTGPSNRSDLGMDSPPLPLSSYLRIFDAFSHISPARPTWEVCRLCCQTILEQFRCSGVALKILPQSITSDIHRTTIIREIEHTTLSAGIPSSFWFLINGKLLLRAVQSSDFPKNLYLVCHPIYSANCQLIGELYLAFPGDVPPLLEQTASRLCIALRYLAMLISSHRELMENATRLELYQHAIELAGDGIGISGLEAKPTLLYVNSKSARFINLGKSDPAFGHYLNQIQTANLRDLRLGGKNSSSRSFFYTRPDGEKCWVNYRSEKVTLGEENFAITFSNMQEGGGNVEHLEGLLSNRELQIVSCLAKGMTNKEISTCLGVSVNTVKFHLSRIFEKMQVTSRSELISRTYPWKL